MILVVEPTCQLRCLLETIIRSFSSSLQFASVAGGSSLP